MYPQERSRQERDWYDVMQACEKGHVITLMAKECPTEMKKRCPQCGTATITQCPKCRAEIQGFHHIPNLEHDGPRRPPAHCHECGEAYPWTELGTVDPSPADQKNAEGAQSNAVFIVHGRDEEMKLHAARALSILGLDPVILHEQPNSGKTIIEKFEVVAEVKFAMILLSPDDTAYPTGSDAANAKARARQNVVLELGYFVGRLGRNRVFILKRGDNLEVPSDFSGVLYTNYDAAGSWRFDLVRELQAAGYKVDANNLL